MDPHLKEGRIYFISIDSQCLEQLYVASFLSKRRQIMLQTSLGVFKMCWISKISEKKPDRVSNKKMIVAELDSSGFDVSKQIAVRALHRGEQRGQHPRTTPSLTQQHIKAKLNFAHEHLKRGDEHNSVGSFCCFRHRVLCSEKKRIVLTF